MPPEAAAPAAPAPVAAKTAAPAQASTGPGKMTPPAGTRPAGSPSATKTAADRLGKFATEAGKRGPDTAPTAAQRQQADTARRQQPPKTEAKPAEGSEPEKAKAAAVPDKPGTQAKTGTVVEGDEGKAGGEGQAATESADDGFPTIEAAQKMKSGELGRHYKNLKQELAKVRGELTKVKAKTGEANPELTTLKETLKQREDRLAAVESELRYTNYEASDEFKTQYWQPYEAAYQTARNKVSGLKVVEQKDDLGEVVSPARKGTAEDFDRLVSIPDDGDAAELAGKLFGNAASVALLHREKVLELNAAKENAKEKFKKEGGEIFKQRQEAWQKQQAETAQVYEKSVKDAVEKFPHWFKPVEGDDEGNALLEKGFEFADSAFSGKVKNADGTERNLTPKELAERHAVLRNKAAAFDRLWRQLREQKRLAEEYQKKLKEFEASEPGEGDGGGDPAGAEGAEDKGPKSGKDAVAKRMSRFL